MLLYLFSAEAAVRFPNTGGYTHRNTTHLCRRRGFIAAAGFSRSSTPASPNIPFLKASRSSGHEEEGCKLLYLDAHAGPGGGLVRHGAADVHGRSLQGVSARICSNRTIFLQAGRCINGKNLHAWRLVAFPPVRRAVGLLSVSCCVDSSACPDQTAPVSDSPVATFWFQKNSNRPRVRKSPMVSTRNAATAQVPAWFNPYRPAGHMMKEATMGVVPCG